MTDVQDAQVLEVQSQSEKTSQDPAETKFTDYPFAESIFQDIQAAGFVRPTPIQAACIPPALEGKDIIGLAQTGTGKTAAFALPIIQKLAQSVELAALVLTPTRELAMQVTGVFNQLGKCSGIRVATIVGGIPMENDYKALRSWPNILVATPGRLIDHLTYGSISLKEIQVLVVDEADRMHDMGFIPQIRRILDELPTSRQTMMFTATMPKDVERIARMSMNNPIRIQVGRQIPVDGAKQQLFRVNDDEKGSLLMKLLSDSEGQGRVLVFVRTKRGCDKLHRIVSRRLMAARIHGDREQCDRDDAMNGFREGRYRILIATDIAARGIDVADIEHVINYDFPLSAEDYVHRIGRTARQQATGLATSFVTPNDRRYLLDAYKLLGEKLPLTDDLKDMLNHRSRSPARGGHGSGRGSHGGRAREHVRAAAEAQPEVEVVLHHRENVTDSKPGTGQQDSGRSQGGGRRRRGRRGGSRQAVNTAQPQASGEPRQPHQSHNGGRDDGRKTTHEPAAAEGSGHGRSESRGHTSKPPHRRNEDNDDGGVVILDRCDDGPDGIVGEEERRGPRRRGGRSGGRRSPRGRNASQAKPAPDAQEAAQ